MDLRFPVGRFAWADPVDSTQRPQWIAEIGGAGARFREAVHGLDDSQLDTPYRPEGWTVRQVIHHVPDSHMNCYVRFRMALTEDLPTIKPYDEQKWAELSDARTAPVEVSLQLLENLHTRWVALIGSMAESDFGRQYRHPENGLVSLDTVLAGYAWHCRHHAAHITALRERMAWK
jgi:hypothetical protein